MCKQKMDKSKLKSFKRLNKKDVPTGYSLFKGIAEANKFEGNDVDDYNELLDINKTTELYKSIGLTVKELNDYRKKMIDEGKDPLSPGNFINEYGKPLYNKVKKILSLCSDEMIKNLKPTFFGMLIQ